MSVMRLRGLRSIVAMAVVGSGLTLISHSADAAPTINFSINVLGGTGGPFNTAFAAPTNPTATPGIFEATSGAPLVGPNNEWVIESWNVTADDDPSAAGSPPNARLNPNFTIMNNLADGATAADNHLQFSIFINMNLLGAVTSIAGNGGPTITVPAGQLYEGQLTTTGGPMVTFTGNGNPVASLFPAGTVLAASSNPGGGSSTNSLSANLPLTPTASITNIGLRFDFDLTPGERVTFNMQYFAVPAPAALGLLGLAGLVGSRRRRG